MFCQKCGEKLSDEAQFCSKCGEKQMMSVSNTCSACGTRLEDEAKFCSKCGRVIVQQDRGFCRHCGQKLSGPGDFCPACGMRIEPPPHPVTHTSTAAGSHTPNGWKARLSTPLTPVMIMTLKHFAATLAFLFMIILWMLPVYHVEKSGSWHSSSYDFSVSLLNLYGDSDMKFLADLSTQERETTAIIALVRSLLLEIIPMLIALWCLIAPVMKGTVAKHRRLILPKIVAIWALGQLLLNLIILNVYAHENLGESASVSLTFGGWVILLLSAALITLLFGISRDNKRLQLRAQQDAPSGAVHTDETV